jgi:hypothetical protein
MPTDVRFRGQSRHHADMLECRLLTQGGHTMQRLGQVNAAGRRHAAPVNADRLRPIRHTDSIGPGRRRQFRRDHE